MAQQVYINAVLQSGEFGQGWKGSVANYAALPAAGPSNNGDIYYVQASTGILWGQRKGLYSSDGASWTRLSNVTFKVIDTEAEFSDNADNTKKMDFQLSSITAGNTRTITMADFDVDLGLLYSPVYIYGLESERATLFSVSLYAGECRDNDNTYNMTNSGTLTCNITVSGANGLDTGSEANSTWYWLFLIEKSSDGTEASLFSTSRFSPTLPSGYDKFRLVAAYYNDSSGNLVKCFFTGMGFRKTATYAGRQTIIVGGTAAAFTLLSAATSLPPGTREYGFVFRINGAGDLQVREGGGAGSFQLEHEGDGSDELRGYARFICDTSQQIEYQTSAATNVAIYTHDYVFNCEVG
jgi:hypothetical protein